MRLTERRIGLLFAFSLLMLLGLLTRAFWLQGVQGAELSSQATSQQTSEVMVPGLRGPILDRTGKELAGSEEAVSIYATPYQVEDPPKAAREIAEILGADEKAVYESLTADSGFSYVARKVGLAKAHRIEQLEIEGIGELPDTVRTRPQGDLAAQVIGAVGTEGDALTGIEALEDGTLAGVNGERRLVKDALGETIRLDNVRDASDGEPVQLTIDAAIQAEAEAVLAGVGESYAPKNATAIVMDTRSSEILAMASWPPLDLDDPESWDEEELVNLGTALNYEPGSTFKAFTVAAALQDKLVTPETSFTLPPTIKVADRTIEEAHARGTVTLSVADILAQSSNVGAVTIGLELGAKRFSQWVDRFGFGRPTGVQYPAEERGIVLPLEEYSGSSIGNMPIGQGIAVTPMQMVQAYGALANGGVLRSPQLVESIGGEEVPADRGRRVLSPEVASRVRQMLEGVLAEGGTASEVSVPGYTLAGKTGTAEVAVDGGYSESRYVASFMGIAPAEDPALMISVIVNEPQYEHTGGAVAAPAFGDIASFALPYLGIPPE